VSWFRAFELLEILVFFLSFFSFNFLKFSFQFFFGVCGGLCAKREEESLVFCGERKKVILRIVLLFLKIVSTNGATTTASYICSRVFLERGIGVPASSRCY
jgi:hypothetical protein